MAPVVIVQSRLTCFVTLTSNSSIGCTSMDSHPHPRTTSPPPVRNRTRERSRFFVKWRRVYADTGRFDTLRVDDLPLSDLIPPREAQQPLPFSPLETLPGPPTKPGWYWWSDDRVELVNRPVSQLGANDVVVFAGNGSELSPARLDITEASLHRRMSLICPFIIGLRTIPTSPGSA